MPFMTIERHIIEQQSRHPQATGAFSHLLNDMALAAKIIARETTRAGLVNILGEAGNTNVFGEMQQKLDIFAHDTIFRMNDHTGLLCLMASEEHEDIILIPDRFTSGKYVLVFDPLDGSSNVDVNASIGTIFAIFRKVSNGDRGSLEDALQSGRALAAAGYIVYGPSTMLVYSAGHGVHGFTLDPSVGEFLLSHPNMMMPSAPKYFSCNEGKVRHWSTGTRRYLDWLKGLIPGDQPSRPLDGRFMGALVADFHRILLKGGVYLYPGDLRDPSNPGGKLRLIYECAPLAYLAEQAGGYGSDGLGNILDIQPRLLHQRVPLFIGDPALVRKAEALIQEHDSAWQERYLAYREGTLSTS